MLLPARVAVLVGAATFLAAAPAAQATVSADDPGTVTTVTPEPAPPPASPTEQVITILVPVAPPKKTAETPKPVTSQPATPPAQPRATTRRRTVTPARSSTTAGRTARVRVVKPRRRGGMALRVALPPAPRGGASVVPIVPRTRSVEPAIAAPAAPVASATAVQAAGGGSKVPRWMLGGLALVVLAELVLMGRFAWRRLEAWRMRRRARMIDSTLSRL